MTSADMHGKLVLITGANSGLGLVSAERLAERGAEVLMICRDRRKGEAALENVARRAAGPAPVLFLTDLSSQASLARLIEDVRGRYDRIDVLLNNAGAVFPRREKSAEGIELTFATNHLAAFILSLRLFDLLKAAPSGRIVTVSSRLHAARLDFDNLQGELNYGVISAYARSKLENILFTYELARRIEGSGVTANCLAPGLVATNFGVNTGRLISLIPRLLALTPLAITPEEGAKTQVYLAASPEVEGISGRYFFKCKEKRTKPVSYDATAASKLWEISVRLTGLSPSWPDGDASARSQGSSSVSQ